MSEDIIYVKANQVKCEGEAQVIGHPLVYLEIKNGEDNIICPYCSRKFILRTEN